MRGTLGGTNTSKSKTRPIASFQRSSPTSNIMLASHRVASHRTQQIPATTTAAAHLRHSNALMVTPEEPWDFVPKRGDKKTISIDPSQQSNRGGGVSRNNSQPLSRVSSTVDASKSRKRSKKQRKVHRNKIVNGKLFDNNDGQYKRKRYLKKSVSSISQRYSRNFKTPNQVVQASASLAVPDPSYFHRSKSNFSNVGNVSMQRAASSKLRRS